MPRAQSMAPEGDERAYRLWACNQSDVVADSRRATAVNRIEAARAFPSRAPIRRLAGWSRLGRSAAVQKLAARFVRTS
jgi:hypothetical protein